VLRITSADYKYRRTERLVNDILQKSTTTVDPRASRPAIVLLESGDCRDSVVEFR